MAFWGVQVKPGKPYTHAGSTNTRGRLHVSQATLGIGTAVSEASKRGVVFLQCNVGSKSPVFLCALSFEKLISCSVNVQFEEEEDVIFSVIGPCTVHLTGYYMRSNGMTGQDNESESFGEDINETETDKSVGTEEDKYEDSFIDDDDELEVFSPSPVFSDEDNLEINKTKNSKSSLRRLKKKMSARHCTDVEQQKGFGNRRARTILSDEESDDHHLISSIMKSSEYNTSEDDNHGTKMKTLCIEKKDGVKGGITIVEADNAVNRSADYGPSRRNNSHSPLPADDMVHTEKDQNKKMVWPEAKNDLKQETEYDADAETHASSKMLHVGESKQLVDDRKRKRKKKEIAAENYIEANYEVHDNACGKIKGQDKEKGDILSTNMSSAQTNLENEMNVSSLQHNPDQSPKNQVKSKKRKTQGNNDAKNALMLNAELASVVNGSCPDGISPSELVIEDLNFGQPESKVAVSGKKVTIKYSAKVKETGKAFDFRADDSPLKFRLGKGKGKAIKGLEMGIDGMRVGARRKLTIPPSLGYGIQGNGDVVPPNSWLIYEVELLKVR